HFKQPIQHHQLAESQGQQHPIQQNQSPEPQPPPQQQPNQQNQLPEPQQQQQSTQQNRLPETQQQQQQQQNPGYTDNRGYYYPYPYQNVNWFNFPYVWSSAASGQFDPTVPLAGVGAQSTGSSTNNECPVGFCPRGGTCSQLSGQWQCACGANGC
ncbi:unnamed protein product, partial [Rotaria sordida]